VVQIPRHYGVPFESVNVLEDMAIREGIKEYSNWPTIPQLYVDGEFVGGCDILTELHSRGELAPLLSQTASASESPGKTP
jgi:monothiol glutaredoxin